MSILFIDDDPRRAAAFRKAHGKIFWAESAIVAAAALTFFKDGELSSIYLDCDGVRGEYLAGRIAAMDIHKSAKIIIHSSNYPGSIKMRDTLQDAGYDVELKSFEETVA